MIDQLQQTSIYSNGVEDKIKRSARKPDYVYVLPSSLTSRAKIGWSRAPMSRINGLVNKYPEIDLTRAVLIEVDTQRIERVLHTVFHRFRAPDEKRLDGFSEWFTGEWAEEVIEFCQWISVQRGCRYSVTRDLSAHLQEYRSVVLNAGSRQPRLSREELKIRSAEAVQRLIGEGLDRVDDLISLLCDRRLDGVLKQPDGDFLVRTVLRTEEPDAWPSEGQPMITAWARQVLELANVDLVAPYASFCFRLFDHSRFIPIDEQHGYEMLRIVSAGTPMPVPDPRTASIEALRHYLDTLSQIDPADLGIALTH